MAQLWFGCAECVYLQLSVSKSLAAFFLRQLLGQFNQGDLPVQRRDR